MRKRPVLGCLGVFDDPVPRSGPENMAIDELLLESVTTPVLRFYGWKGDWGSFGYFKRLQEARAAFIDANLQWVRRRSGGGIVDHRCDFTYSLILPRCEPLASSRGATSYALIHEALAEALASSGVALGDLAETRDNGDARCFVNPVLHDLVSPDGIKISGAGQHRGRQGLLHQGSIQGCKPDESWKERFVSALAAGESYKFSLGQSFEARISECVERRYGHPNWLHRR